MREQNFTQFLFKHPSYQELIHRYSTDPQGRTSCSCCTRLFTGRLPFQSPIYNSYLAQMTLKTELFQVYVLQLDSCKYVKYLIHKLHTFMKPIMSHWSMVIKDSVMHNSPQLSCIVLYLHQSIAVSSQPQLGLCTTWE